MRTHVCVKKSYPGFVFGPLDRHDGPFGDTTEKHERFFVFQKL